MIIYNLYKNVVFLAGQILVNTKTIKWKRKYTFIKGKRIIIRLKHSDKWCVKWYWIKTVGQNLEFKSINEISFRMWFLIQLYLWNYEIFKNSQFYILNQYRCQIRPIENPSEKKRSNSLTRRKFQNVLWPGES